MRRARSFLLLVGLVVMIRPAVETGYAQAPAAAVTGYPDINYGGTRTVIAQDVSDLTRVFGPCSANWNDCLSSLSVPTGWSVTVYQDIDYRGASAVFIGDAPDLRSVSGPCAETWNDCISSIKIRPLVASGSLPLSGDSVGAFAALDRVTAALMQQYHVPGVAIGITKNGRLVFARGYGYADRDSGRAVSPDSRFRLASISKPITATAIDRLVERGALAYTSKVFDVLRAPLGLEYPRQDPRIAEATVNQFLSHQSGWADGLGGNRYGDVDAASKALSVPRPIAFADLIRYEFGKRLDFQPGAPGTNYCNFCYGVLAQVIETVSGTSYESFVRNQVLAGIDVRRTALAEETAAARLSGEVAYYTPSGTAYSSSALRPGPAAGAGGWISTAPDMLRFVAAVTLGTKPAMFATPPRNGWGFSGLPIGRGFVWVHDGSLPGTATTLVIRDDVAWCILTNGQTQAAAGSFVEEMNQIVTTTVQTLSAWPGTDAFPRYVASRN